MRSGERERLTLSYARRNSARSPIVVARRDVSTFEEKDLVVMRARLVYLRAVAEAKCSRVREVETVIRRVSDRIPCCS
ncbi:hypothetical protein DF153_32760 [Burkholderia cenocepacia]|nr:hypothetical protein CFB49_28985 [Burkholderia sp. AU17457]OXI65575.1 hypothetical protein CFB81_28690 [Burkholderia sp. AU28863]RQU05674.1 hypothetical protein DF152_33810 [Burkholderia cenocepacia]RQU12572.1 hypothetical protein DF153_32760 [Burkholderia cenocepacia]